MIKRVNGFQTYDGLVFVEEARAIDHEETNQKMLMCKKFSELFNEGTAYNPKEIATHLYNVWEQMLEFIGTVPFFTVTRELVEVEVEEVVEPVILYVDRIVEVPAEPTIIPVEEEELDNQGDEFYEGIIEEPVIDQPLDTPEEEVILEDEEEIIANEPVVDEDIPEEEVVVEPKPDDLWEDNSSQLNLFDHEQPIPEEDAPEDIPSEPIIEDPIEPTEEPVVEPNE